MDWVWFWVGTAALVLLIFVVVDWRMRRAERSLQRKAQGGIDTIASALQAHMDGQVRGLNILLHQGRQANQCSYEAMVELMTVAHSAIAELCGLLVRRDLLPLDDVIALQNRTMSEAQAIRVRAVAEVARILERSQ